MKLPGSEVFQIGPMLPEIHSYVSPQSRRTSGELGGLQDESAECSCTNCPDQHMPDVSLQELRQFYVYGGTPGDFLWYPTAWLVGEEALCGIMAESPSGVEVRPVEFFRDMKCRNSVAGYVELRIVGRVPMDLQRSGCQVEYECPICGATQWSQWKKESGLHFTGSPEDWPDIFMMEPLIATLVFAKPVLAQLVVERGWSPVAITRIEDALPLEWSGQSS